MLAGWACGAKRDGWAWLGPEKNKLCSVWLTVILLRDELQHVLLCDIACQRVNFALAGWFAAAVPLGGFGREARGGRAGAAALAAAKCWAVGVPVRRHIRIRVRAWTLFFKSLRVGTDCLMGGYMP